MNIFTVAYVFWFSILDFLHTVADKLAVVINFLNGPFASHLQKDPWQTARCQSQSVSNLCFFFTISLCLTNCTFHFSYSVNLKGAVQKRIYLLNKDIVRLIDDTFSEEEEADPPVGAGIIVIPD